MAFAIHPSPVSSHTTGRERLSVSLPAAKCSAAVYYWAGSTVRLVCLAAKCPERILLGGIAGLAWWLPA